MSRFKQSTEMEKNHAGLVIAFGTSSFKQYLVCTEEEELFSKMSDIMTLA